MATQVQRRRGTTAQHAAFSGQLAETTIDTDKMTVVVQDGVTLGGHPLATEANLTAHISDTTAAHAASAVSILDTALNFTATDVEGALAELAAVAGGLLYFTEDRNTAAPNATVPVHSAKVAGAETNIDVGLIPKGTGAVLASIPDGTATGGSKRGTNAVDLQTSRGVATQAALGNFSAVLSGSNNSAYGSHSAVLSGNTNYANGIYSVTCGGRFTGNQSGGDYSFVGGGYDVSSQGSYGVACGGLNCDGDINSNYTVVSGGSDNLVSGHYSTIPGGYWGLTRNLYGRYSYASGRFTVAGDAQIGTHVQRVTTTNATPVVLTSDGGAISATNTSVLPNNHAYNVKARIIARDTATGDVVAWIIDGVVKRGANAASTALVGVPTKTILARDAGAPTWAVDLIPDTTLGAAEIQVTGEAATIIHWVCNFETVEVG
jgi:hypothetical protein